MAKIHKFGISYKGNSGKWKFGKLRIGQVGFREYGNSKNGNSGKWDFGKNGQVGIRENFNSGKMFRENGIRETGGNR